MKKIPEDIFILHLCTTNDNHMYGSWDKQSDRQNFFVILELFLPLPPLTTPKNKILKKWKKKHLQASSFYTSVPKTMILCYAVPAIWCAMDVIFVFHFGLRFALLPPLKVWKLKINKKWKKTPGDIIIKMTKVTPVKF